MKKITIVQISDIHCGSSYFDEGLMDKVVGQVNEMATDVLILSGDLTSEGFLNEFEEAKHHIGRFKVRRKLIVPGNHDARNVGYRLYERIIGNPFKVIRMNRDMIICGADSTEPDLDDGQIGRHHTMELKKVLSDDYHVKILVMHHHALPIPNSGRERNILADAGDVLKMARKCGVDLILSGHKHVPWLWDLEGMKILTCSTTTSRRVRGLQTPSYNVIEVSSRTMTITRCSVETGKRLKLYEGGYSRK